MSFSPLKSLLIAAVLGAGLTGVAVARDQVITAQLSQPVAARTQVIADSAVWTCEGDTCRAISHHPSSVHVCRLFVREAGAVVSFGPEAAALSGEELARCNGDAPTQTAQAHN